MARPLTKKSKEGQLYVRPPEVEAQIDDVLLDDLPTLKRRLLVSDRSSADYLRSETLVHIIRSAARDRHDLRRDATLTVLFVRCEANLEAKIRNDFPNAETLRAEVLSELGRLIVLDGTGDIPDELDYYECKFNSAFRTLRIDIVRREVTELNRIANPLEDDEFDDSEDPAEPFRGVAKALQTPANQESAVFLEELAAAIDALPPDEREAIVLVHVMGYEQESTDPQKETAATRCGCEGRTIRNRLSRGALKLSRFKETS